MLLDRWIVHFDRALRTVFAPAATVRPLPGGELPELSMSAEQRAETAALMRVNHCGEVCAQALYQGQAITAQTDSVRAELEQAADEETEHLAWTEHRIAELGGRKSLLNPLWYASSLTLGMLAGKLGDKWSLGFLSETERQVEAHLSSHLERVPTADGRTRAILEQMKADEIKHAETAQHLGGAPLPGPVRFAMKAMGKVMTTVAYRV